MGVKERSGETSPMKNAEPMMMKMGISLATIVTFCSTEPRLMPKQL